MAHNGFIKSLAKRIVETSTYDRETNTLYTTAPGISYDALKGLAKKYNFTVGQTEEGDFVSIPNALKPYAFDPSELSLYDDFLKTYTNYDNNYPTLLEAYKTLDSMEENVSEVNLILDTYVAEVLSQGFIENPLSIRISDKKAQALVEKVLYKNKIYQKLPGITKSLAKYGNLGIALVYPYLEKWMSDEKVGEIRRIDVVEDLVLKIVNPKNFKVNADEYGNPINYQTEMFDSKHNSVKSTSILDQRTWQAWQFCHMLIQDESTEPYGKSLLWSMRSAFDQLVTLEALLGISRASNIQRLVFYVPLPNGTNMIDSYKYLNDFRTNYLNSIFTDAKAAKAGRKLPGAMSILTLPMAADGKKAEFETIEAKIDLGSTDDVEYFLDKILRNSSLPKGYLVGDETITTAQTLEAQDLKLKRTLIPLKQALINGMLNLVEKILTHAGYDVSKIDVQVSLNSPIQVAADTLEKYGAVAELVDNLIKLNPEMTTINRFQLMVKLGMPADIAGLICGKASVNALDNVDDLAQFLNGQKAKNPGMIQAQPQVEESVSVSSKDYLKREVLLAETLKDVYNTMITEDTQVLNESVLKVHKTTLHD